MTIKDIAKEAGYSVGTVSRVLNNQEGVSEKARVAVTAVVEKYNFKLNTNAKHLKQQNQYGVAIIIKGTQNMLFAAIVEQMQGLIKKSGYDCNMYYIAEYENEVEYALQLCRERHPLGILFLGSSIENFRKQFEAVDVPCVLVTNSAKELDFKNLSSVTTDDEAAAKFVMEYLMSIGHDEIGVLGGDQRLSMAAVSRLKGCIKAYDEKGMHFDLDRQYEAAEFSISAGYYAMEHLMDKMPELTAVFAMSDVMALGAIRAICDRGMRVPEDISVVGFDGIDIGRYMSPRLTTIRQHRESIAKRSVEILVDNIRQTGEACYEIEPFHLVNGDSIAHRK